MLFYLPVSWTAVILELDKLTINTCLKVGNHGALEIENSVLQKKASWVGVKVVPLHPEFSPNCLVYILRWLMIPPGRTFGSLPPPGNASGSMPCPRDKVCVGPNISGVLCEGEQGRALESGGAGQEGDHKSKSIQQSCPQPISSKQASEENRNFKCVCSFV